MTAEQTMRQRAMELAIQMHTEGAANTQGADTDDDLIRLAERVYNFINAGTVPAQPE